jgi:hypothetical protein
MKYLKLFESYTESDIAEICKKYGIFNWSINSEGLVDVDGGVYLSREELTELPLNFGHVSGDFYCSNNELTSLKGSPRSVGKDFFCFSNELISLQGSPREVGGNFSCYNNRLTSLEGGPLTIGGMFFCHNNKITSLRFAPEEVEGVITILPNPISNIPENYLTREYLEFIVKEQNNDWRLYRKDGTIYPERLEQMIEWGIETKKIKPL